jgi:hypothetical protein
MTDDTKPVEGNSHSAGEAQPSTAPASENESQRLPEYVTTILSRIDAVEKLARGVQKGTDKQIKNQINGSIERILELAKEGKSQKQIERELWLDSLMEGRNVADAEPVADNDSKANGADMSKVIDEVLQLPANDPRVTKLKLEHGNDTAAYMREALKLAARLAEANDDSTPAEQPLPTGGTARKVDNPIADIDDPKLLYRLAAQQMARGRRK